MTHGTTPETLLPSTTAPRAAPRPGTRLHRTSWIVLFTVGFLCLVLAWTGHTASTLSVELRVIFSALGVAGLLAAAMVVFCLAYLHALPEFLRFRWKARHGSLAGYKSHRISSDASALLRARTPAGRRVIRLRDGIW